jgi:hypothetical protein
MRLDGDPKEVARSLREQYGPYQSWIVATHQADQASAVSDLKIASFWRRVVSALDGLEG